MEQIAQFGENNRINGIHNLGNSQRIGAGPAVLLINAGAVHRIGVHRMNVRLARAFADLGYQSLRFDLSGLGDTRPPQQAVGYAQQSVEDIQAAMDYLQRETDATEFVIMGLCSGADNAYRSALEDERLKGAVMLDPYAYAHPAARTESMKRRALDMHRWKRLFKKVVKGGGEEADLTKVDAQLADLSDADRDDPPLEVFGGQLQKITLRGAELLMLYSSYAQEHITRREQFFDLFKEFDFAGRLDVDVLTHVDHAYTELSAQAELQERISVWLSQHWPLDR